MLELSYTHHFVVVVGAPFHVYGQVGPHLALFLPLRLM